MTVTTQRKWRGKVLRPREKAAGAEARDRRPDTANIRVFENDITNREVRQKHVTV